jgi:hypothetical protein
MECLCDGRRSCNTSIYRLGASTKKQCRAGSHMWLCLAEGVELDKVNIATPDFLLWQTKSRLPLLNFGFCYALFLFSCLKSEHVPAELANYYEEERTKFNLRKFWECSRITGYLFFILYITHHHTIPSFARRTTSLTISLHIHPHELLEPSQQK